MSDGDGVGDKNKLPQDWLIEQILHNDVEIPNVIMLVGFLGKNTGLNKEDDKHRRLYLTPTLNDYITFHIDDVVLHRPPPQDSPMDGSTIWLKRNAIVQRTRIESHQIQAEFLQGSITGDVRPSLPSLPGEADADGNPWTMVNCPPSILRC